MNIEADTNKNNVNSTVNIKKKKKIDFIDDRIFSSNSEYDSEPILSYLVNKYLN